MPGNGKSLEQLIYALEKALGHDDNVLVESPKRIPDKITGKKREHDVVLVIDRGHHKIIVAIECRDLSRPITVNQIEGFWKKCQDTGIDKAIIVSTMGFYNTAREKADFLGISCLDIEEVDSFDWMLAPGIHLLQKNLLHHEWVFFPEKDNIANKNNTEIFDTEGNVLLNEHLASQALEQLKSLLPDSQEPVEKDVLTVKFPGGNLTIRNTETNKTTPVKYAIAKIYYSITNEVIPFKLIQYKDADKNITDAAVAPMNIGDKWGKLMIIEGKDGGKKIMYVPDK